MFSWWEYNRDNRFAAQIQRALVRNNQTQRFSQRQALRLHQGLVTSTAEQVGLVSVRSHLRLFVSVCTCNTPPPVCFQGDGAPLCACPAAGVFITGHRRDGGDSSCKTSAKRGEELSRCEWCEMCKRSICIVVTLNMNESFLCGAPSSTLHCVSSLMCCLWMGRCGRDSTPWLANLPKLLTRSCRYI